MVAARVASGAVGRTPSGRLTEVPGIAPESVLSTYRRVATCPPLTGEVLVETSSSVVEVAKGVPTVVVVLGRGSSCTGARTGTRTIESTEVG